MDKEELLQYLSDTHLVMESLRAKKDPLGATTYDSDYVTGSSSHSPAPVSVHVLDFIDNEAIQVAHLAEIARNNNIVDITLLFMLRTKSGRVSGIRTECSYGQPHQLLHLVCEELKKYIDDLVLSPGYDDWSTQASRVRRASLKLAPIDTPHDEWITLEEASRISKYSQETVLAWGMSGLFKLCQWDGCETLVHKQQLMFHVISLDTVKKNKYL